MMYIAMYKWGEPYKMIWFFYQHKYPELRQVYNQEVIDNDILFYKETILLL